MSLGFKELYRQEDYLFYLNNGISKSKLLIFSGLFTFCTAVLIVVMIFLIKEIILKKHTLEVDGIQKRFDESSQIF